MKDSLKEQQWLLDSLQNPELYNHPVTRFELIETHVSWVLLTGDFVYKIKKPVDFGFLDFSTLEKRYLNCCEELRLNRRLAPQLYLGLVSITGAGDGVELDGQGPVLEYAVKMVQFPQTAQLDCLPGENGLTSELVSRLADRVATFHLSIDSAPADSEFGGLDSVRTNVMENFDHIRQCTEDPAVLPELGKLETWSRNQLEQLASLIELRKRQGYVRECHGDMHLRNIAWWRDDIIIFDCIEFNKNLHFIDVISDIAFLIMDLEVRQKNQLASRFLNSYLQITGDYQGLGLLLFYKMYRALVRAKVDILRTGQEQPGSVEYSETFDDFLDYIKLAKGYVSQPPPVLVVSHGVSGTGKSVAARALGEILPAIVVSSDVERKRLFADGEKETRGNAVDQGLYHPDNTRKTYGRLVEIAHSLLASGYCVIVDAANLRTRQRKLFIDLAKQLHLRCCILSYTATAGTLRDRVSKRARRGRDISDATVAILEHQLATCEPFTAEERSYVHEIDTEQPLNVENIVRQVKLR